LKRKKPLPKQTRIWERGASGKKLYSPLACGFVISRTVKDQSSYKTVFLFALPLAAITVRMAAVQLQFDQRVRSNIYSGIAMKFSSHSLRRERPSAQSDFSHERLCG